MTNKQNITGCINRAIEFLENNLDIEDLNLRMHHRMRNKQALADLKAFRDALPDMLGIHASIVKVVGEQADNPNLKYSYKAIKLIAEAVNDE